jgi:hypothetical protein
MKKESERHLVEYTVLIIVLISLVVFFATFSSSKTHLFLISGVGSSLYALWGIIHHAIEGRLTARIAFEYVFFGVLVFLLLFTAISF